MPVYSIHQVERAEALLYELRSKTTSILTYPALDRTLSMRCRIDFSNQAISWVETYSSGIGENMQMFTLIDTLDKKCPGGFVVP
jgi:hypothetical protein